VAPFYIWQMLWEVGYPATVFFILEDGVVIFLQIIEDH
jgi:hypothetical protein